MVAFVRACFADGAFSLYDTSVTLGFGRIPTDRSQDMLGVAFNWSNPIESTYKDTLGAAPEFDSQYTVEVFYRMQLTPWLELTASVQLLNYTAINTGFNEKNQPPLKISASLKARFIF
ncbi:carbohydrate porin [Vibrio diabolicus]